MSEPEIDFLADEAPDEVAPETPAAPEPEAATVEQPETPAPEVPTTPEPQEERVPLAALKAEREKRQNFERQYRELEQKLRRQEEAPPPEFHERPQDYVNHVVTQVQAQTRQQMLTALEAMAREAYEDYDDVLQYVEQKAQDNPALVQKIFSSPNPATAVYKLGKQLKELDEMGDPAAYRAKIEAEVRAKIEAEAKAKEAAKAKAAEAIPPDLSAARASRDGEVLPEDTLESILQSKR